MIESFFCMHEKHIITCYTEAIIPSDDIYCNMTLMEAHYDTTNINIDHVSYIYMYTEA